MAQRSWETEQIGNAAIVKGSEDELKFLRDSLKRLIHTDVYDSINIEFVENETPNLVEKNRALSYLKNCLDIPVNRIDDPSLYPELHSEFSDKKYQIPNIDQFNKFEMIVPCLVASFLVEIFSIDQLPTEKYYFEKRFFQQKTIYNLLIFASFPVSIETVLVNNAPNHCVIKFADTEIASAQFISEQLKFILRFYITKTCFAFYKEVDVLTFKSSYLKKLDEELGCAYLRTSDFNVYENKGSFYLYVLPNQFGEQPRSNIRFILEKLFNNIRLYQCERCRKLATIGRQEECSIQSFVEQDEDMIFPNHQLSSDSPSEFIFNIV